MRTPSRLQRRAMAVPAWLRALILAPSVGLPIYWGFGYSGPYRWLAELQLALFGAYGVILTGLLTALPTLLLGLGIVHALASVYLRGKDEATFRAETDASLMATRVRARENAVWLALGLIALPMLGTGVYFAFDALSSGSKTQVDLATLAAGGEPESRWVDMSGGVPLFAQSYGVEEDGRTRLYVPIAPARPDGTYAVFLEIPESSVERDADALRATVREGLLTRDGLPGMIREQARRDGRLGAGHWVLEWHRTPSLSWILAAVLGGLGVLLGLAALVLRLVRRGRGARSVTNADPGARRAGD